MLSESSPTLKHGPPEAAFSITLGPPVGVPGSQGPALHLEGQWKCTGPSPMLGSEGQGPGLLELVVAGDRKGAGVRRWTGAVPACFCLQLLCACALQAGSSWPCWLWSWSSWCGTPSPEKTGTSSCESPFHILLLVLLRKAWGWSTLQWDTQSGRRVPRARV